MNIDVDGLTERIVDSLMGEGVVRMAAMTTGPTGKEVADYGFSRPALRVHIANEIHSHLKSMKADAEAHLQIQEPTGPASIVIEEEHAISLLMGLIFGLRCLDSMPDLGSSDCLPVKIAKRYMNNRREKLVAMINELHRVVGAKLNSSQKEECATAFEGF